MAGQLRARRQPKALMKNGRGIKSQDAAVEPALSPGNRRAALVVRREPERMPAKNYADPLGNTSNRVADEPGHGTTYPNQKKKKPWASHPSKPTRTHARLDGRKVGGRVPAHSRLKRKAPQVDCASGGPLVAWSAVSRSGRIHPVAGILQPITNQLGALWSCMHSTIENHVSEKATRPLLTPSCRKLTYSLAAPS